MANNDVQFILTGTSSFVVQEFGFWADSQAITVSGAAADISFDGTNAVTLTPYTALEGIAYTNHLRCRIYVRGVGATIRVITSASGV